MKRLIAAFIALFRRGPCGECEWLKLETGSDAKCGGCSECQS